MADSDVFAPRPQTLSTGFLIRAFVIIVIFCGMFASVLRDPASNLSQWHLALAKYHANARDVDRAVQSVAAARRWAPYSDEVLEYQLRIYSEEGELEAAVDELSAALKATPDRNLSRIVGLLLLRSEYLQRLRRHKEAIADVEKVVASVGDDHRLLNTRAYILARAAADGYPVSPSAMGTSLEDMRRVLGATRRFSARVPYLQLQIWNQAAMYLDTYAYLQLQAGNAEEGLRNLNRALELCQTLRLLWQDYSTDLELANLEDMGGQLDEMHAVILHHRGEALKAVGNEAAYFRDIQRAQQGERGYSRQHGRW